MKGGGIPRWAQAWPCSHSRGGRERQWPKWVITAQLIYISTIRMSFSRGSVPGHRLLGEVGPGSLSPLDPFPQEEESQGMSLAFSNSGRRGGRLYLLPALSFVSTEVGDPGLIQTLLLALYEALVDTPSSEPGEHVCCSQTHSGAQALESMMLLWKTTH